jgi:hypothetical protein
MVGLKTLIVFVNALAFTVALPNIIDSLTANNASTLVGLIDQAGLTDTLKTKGKDFFLYPNMHFSHTISYII